MLHSAHLTFASLYEKENTIKCFSIPQNIPTNSYASNSVLLSLATHITFRFPYLNIFTHFQKQCPEIKPQQNQLNTYLTYHPLFQPWCEIFSEAILKNHAIRKDNTLFIALNLSNQQIQKVIEQKEKLHYFTLVQQQKWMQKLLKKVSGIQETSQLPRKPTKIIYLNVSGSQLRTDPYLPVPNVKPIIMGQIYNNENWQSFNILKGDIPTFQKFLDSDNVIIPGSTNSVLSDIPQIKIMSDNMFRAFQVNKKLKIFGICYGHQMIAQKYNGEVVRKIRTDKLEKYSFNEDLIEKLKGIFPFLEKVLHYKDSNSLLEHHEDYVEKVTDDFHILASSQSSKIEFLLHKSGRMLSFQSHPEFLLDFSQGFIDRLVKYTNSPIQIKLGYKDEEQRNNHIDSSLGMRAVIQDFFDYEISE